LSEELTEQKGAGKSRALWLEYGAEILTIFLALAILTGRVYAQSYWNVFGLSAEYIDTAFINYAIMSPNTAVASMLIAIGTVVVIIALFRRQPTDFVGSNNPRVVYIIGWLAFWVGLFAIGIIPKVNLSTWTSGTAGLAFGLGFLSFIGGNLIWIQASLKLEKNKQPKWEVAIFKWLRNIPFVLFQIFIVVGFVAGSLWAITDTAQKFGANEAKMMFDSKPKVILQLDSPKGFEDLAMVPNPSGAASFEVKIITEAGGFLYISPRVTKTPHQLYVRAVPILRVQAIQYVVDVTPLGE